MFRTKKKKKANRLVESLTGLFSRHKARDFNEEFFEELSDLLIEADLGSRLSWQFINELKQQCKQQKINTAEQLVHCLRQLLAAELRICKLSFNEKFPQVILCVGVNGVGKTTNLAKLAHYYKKQGYERLVFGAGDTFRAAAVEQLAQHAQRLGVRFVSQKSGSDPAAVVHDTVSSALARKDQLVLLDTAGRMHSRDNLMQQLQKIDRVLNHLLPREQRHNLLIIDATTGQNALQQAEVFNKAIGVDALLLSKLDSSASGGLAVAISQQLKLAFAFYGTGEAYEDLQTFMSDVYLDAMFAGLKING